MGSSKNRQAEYDLQVKQGRFPANIICTDDALNDNQITKSVARKKPSDTISTPTINMGGGWKSSDNEYTDSGSKSRYFDIDCWGEKYGLLQFPKASKRERNEGCEAGGNNHPTVKPVHVMSWLVRLVSREGDTVLDPFMGSVTTGVVCVQTGRNFIGCEIDEGYFKIAEKRIKEAQQQMSLL